MRVRARIDERASSSARSLPGIRIASRATARAGLAEVPARVRPRRGAWAARAASATRSSSSPSTCRPAVEARRRKRRSAWRARSIPSGSSHRRARTRRMRSSRRPRPRDRATNVSTAPLSSSNVLPRPDPDRIARPLAGRRVSRARLVGRRRRSCCAACASPRSSRCGRDAASCGRRRRTRRAR